GERTPPVDDVSVVHARLRVRHLRVPAGPFTAAEGNALASELELDALACLGCPNGELHDRLEPTDALLCTAAPQGPSTRSKSPTGSSPKSWPRSRRPPSQLVPVSPLRQVPGGSSQIASGRQSRRCRKARLAKRGTTTATSLPRVNP